MASEHHILLRLPDEVADLVEASPPPPVEIVFDPPDDPTVLPQPCGEMATFRVGDRRFRAKLMALPTVVETHKSMDWTDYIKTGHVGQVLVVAADEAELPAGVELRDGLAPPCAQIRERKWRRRPVRDRKEVEQVMVELEAVLKGSLPKPEYEMVEVEVEVTDDEAIDSGEEGDSGDVFGEGSQGDPMQVDGDESSDAGARAVGSAAGHDTSGAESDVEDASTDASLDASLHGSRPAGPSRPAATTLPLRLTLPLLHPPAAATAVVQPPRPAAPRAPSHRDAIPPGGPSASAAQAEPPRPGVLKLSLKLPATAAASKSGSAGAAAAGAAAAAAAGAGAAAMAAAVGAAQGDDDQASLHAALRAAQQRSIKASDEMAAIKALPPPTNPLLRAKQQTHLDALKRQRADADLESAALQERLDGKADASDPKAKGRKGKR